MQLLRTEIEAELADVLDTGRDGFLDASHARQARARVDPDAHPLKPPADLGHAVDPSEVFIPAAIEPDDAAD